LARRLAQEARALERLVHPGLITLLDTGTVGDQAYLVMELVDGPSLSTFLRDGPLSSQDAATLVQGSPTPSRTCTSRGSCTAT